MQPVYYGHIGTIHKYPDYQSVLLIQLQVSLQMHAEAPFETISKCVDYNYSGVLIFNGPD